MKPPLINKFQVTNLSLLFFYIALGCFSALSASAKVIYEQEKHSQKVTIRIEQEITPKDLIEFKTALKQLDESKKTLHMNSVVLESHGGSGDKQP